VHLHLPARAQLAVHRVEGLAGLLVNPDEVELAVVVIGGAGVVAAGNACVAAVQDVLDVYASDMLDLGRKTGLLQDIAPGVIGICIEF